MVSFFSNCAEFTSCIMEADKQTLKFKEEKTMLDLTIRDALKYVGGIGLTILGGVMAIRAYAKKANEEPEPAFVEEPKEEPVEESKDSEATTETN